MGQATHPGEGRKPDEFRNYAAEARSSVREFYRLNHTHQTLEFVLAKKKEYLTLDRMEMTVWEALEYMNQLVDDSDPEATVHLDRKTASGDREADVVCEELSGSR